ncbi:hypothetical protein ASD28_13600 [Massilia sp. Root133]|uniref:hypothetical protein n=1 Tax=unclassified Massilia TaxID=2609279 RepID=UPI0006F82CB7|nr:MULTISPECIES: hypothetical protein [unclassified Massilia]KQY00341.1 hypothetical protein ASD28_13600 [Massilia sp. Root133]KQZ38950.1 hypothetical protein ASD92_03515 [Massilia sp. Root1485]
MSQTTMVVFDCTKPEVPIPMASFSLVDNGNGRLRYGTDYLQREDAFSIDPKYLRLQEKEIPVSRQPDNTYGALSDAGPNTWGTKLKIQLLHKDKKPFPENAVEWFLQSKHFGSGCLAFAARPDEPPRLCEVPSRSMSLTKHLLDALSQYLTDPDRYLDTEIVNLLFPGSDLGGLRPKTIKVDPSVKTLSRLV